MSDRIVKLRILLLWIRSEFRQWQKEIWRRDLDGRFCCDGRECMCGGQTIREVYAPAVSENDDL